jgi:ubiquinone/menaquinone biosynthesis C-methylase UbiE
MRQSAPTAALYLSNTGQHEQEQGAEPGYWLARLTVWLFEQAGITTGMRVLDLGSSAGELVLLLAELVGPTGSIVSVELNPALWEVAQERTSGAGLTNVSWHIADGCDLALEQEFDAVVGRNSLLYLADPPAVVRHCLEHLRPGGVVAFQEVEKSVWKQLAQLLAFPALGEQGQFCMAGCQEKTPVEQVEQHSLSPRFFMAGVWGRKVS